MCQVTYHKAKADECKQQMVSSERVGAPHSDFRGKIHKLLQADRHKQARLMGRAKEDADELSVRNTSAHALEALKRQLHEANHQIARYEKLTGVPRADVLANTAKRADVYKGLTTGDHGFDTEFTSGSPEVPIRSKVDPSIKLFDVDMEEH